jgi:hypothetical protein
MRYELSSAAGSGTDSASPRLPMRTSKSEPNTEVSTGRWTSALPDGGARMTSHLPHHLTPIGGKNGRGKWRPAAANVASRVLKNSSKSSERAENSYQ